MEAFLEEFQHLRIRLEAVNLATNNFDESNVIGRGGFGKVYAGLLIHSKGTHKAAFKRLNRDHGQGDPQFWKEIMMLSGYTHENLISLLGFCDEGGEKIVVYERACHGSLDKHLSSTNVTWCQRLKICLTAARGLCYLHDPHGTHQRVIHRDVKSSNILLDENWNAKVADMGLSKFGPANQPHSFLPTNVAGTHGYIDPLYMKTCSLTKESDIYSFGVVLFEVLCGRLCYKFNNGTFESLVPIWKQSYEKNQLDHIIFKCLAQYMDLRSLEMFSDIAYRCLNEFREKRPQMSDVVEKLENALHFQEISEEVEPSMDYEQMIMTAKRPLVYSSEKELKTLLSKGILLNRGLTWFLLTKTGEHCQMISAAECLLPVCSESREYSDDNKFASLKTARFTFKADYLAIVRRNFKTHVKTQFLSPHTTYAVNLVFQFCYEEITWLQRKNFADLNYKLAGEGKFSNLFLIEKRDDGWLKAELYQFTSNRRSIDLEIMFEYRKDSLVVQGIEFQPVERVEPEALEDEEVDMQTHPDKYWEKKLPTDYKKIIQLSDITVKWTTKKELYDILCKGFPCKAGKEWFCLAKNGEKCRMLSPRVALLDREWRWGSLPESRFEEVAFDPYRTVFRIECKSYLVSPQTRYKCYLVYKFKYDPQCRLPVEVYVGGDSWYIFLLTPQIPVIRRKVYQNTHNPLNRPKAKYLPKQRNDGWMEVLLWEFQTGITNESTISKNITLTALDENLFRGLTVQGIEFKTI